MEFQIYSNLCNCKITSNRKGNPALPSLYLFLSNSIREWFSFKGSPRQIKKSRSYLGHLLNLIKVKRLRVSFIKECKQSIIRCWILLRTIWWLFIIKHSWQSKRMNTANYTLFFTSKVTIAWVLPIKIKMIQIKPQ